MNSKTAVTVLQELMVKRGQQAVYECISQSGPEHIARFEYRCIALGVTATATAGSKKEAKQEAARKVLLILASHGQPVPPPFCLPPPTSGPSAAGAAKLPLLGANSYVALLKEMCIEYHLPAVEFTLIGDAGPPHLRQFTIRARLGQHERIATAGSKKTARQMAAEQLYTYMRENLARLTKDFVEEEAIVRQHERAMERYVEIRDEAVWRPDLGQRIADYHLGLVTHIETEKCELARRALENETAAGAAAVDKGSIAEAAEATFKAAVTALGLTINTMSLEAENGPLILLELIPTSPALSFCATSPVAAYLKGIDHLRRALS